VGSSSGVQEFQEFKEFKEFRSPLVSARRDVRIVFLI